MIVDYEMGDVLAITVNTAYDCVMTQKNKDGDILYTIDPLPPGSGTYAINEGAAYQCVSKKAAQGMAPLPEVCMSMYQGPRVPSLNTYGMITLILLLAGAAVWQFRRTRKTSIIQS